MDHNVGLENLTETSTVMFTDTPTKRALHGLCHNLHWEIPPEIQKVLDNHMGHDRTGTSTETPPWRTPQRLLQNPWQKETQNIPQHRTHRESHNPLLSQHCISGSSLTVSQRPEGSQDLEDGTIRYLRNSGVAFGYRKFLRVGPRVLEGNDRHSKTTFKTLRD